MHRFWSRYIHKLIEAAAPARMMEVGAEFGWNTEKLLQYCRGAGCKLDVVDPLPHPALHDVLAGYPAEHAYHPLTSLAAIPLLPPADLILLDGDHNWYTVYNELQLIFARSVETATPAPIILFHDVAWPYARRDMYYDPSAIPDSARHEYAFRGILPGQSALSDEGLNGGFRNALHEGGLRNGVLTGIEDFVAGWPEPTSLHMLPFFNGLGILIPQARNTRRMAQVIDDFFGAEMMSQSCAILEQDGMGVRAELAACRLALSRSREALVRGK